MITLKFPDGKEMEVSEKSFPIEVVNADGKKYILRITRDGRLILN